MTDDEKKEIELIDFPGLNSREYDPFQKSIIEPIVKFSNGFLFITKPSIKIKDNSAIISQTFEKISKRKVLDKSLDSFLFVITHYEESSDLNLESKKNEIKRIIFDEDLYSFVSGLYVYKHIASVVLGSCCK